MDVVDDRRADVVSAQPRRAPPKSNATSGAHTTSASAAAAPPQTDAAAAAVGTARMRCAYPITLMLRSDPTASEALWVQGPPARPVIHLSEDTHADFDMVATAMSALVPGADRRRTSPRRAPAARSLLDARVSLTKTEDDDNPVVATVPLTTLLDSVVDQGRAGRVALCVARSASWVGQALARRPPLASRPQRSAERARSDMERMMRRLDRIVSRVASQAARDRTGHMSDDDGGDDGNGHDDNDDHGDHREDTQPSSVETLDTTMDDDDDIVIITRALVPSTRGQQGPVSTQRSPLVTEGGSVETRAPQRRRQTAKRSRPEVTTTTTTTTARPRPAKRTRKSLTTDVSASLGPLSRTMSPVLSLDMSSDATHTVPEAVCDIVLRPCAEAPSIECSICMRDDGTVLWDVPLAQPATLHDLWTDPDRHVLVANGARLADDVILVNPCRNADHAVCVGCMRTVLLNRGRPPVSVTRAAVGCVSLDGESRCAATAYPEAHPFALVLDGDEALNLAGLYDRHRFPGMEVIPCPLHVVIDRPVPAGRRRGPRVEVIPCGAECIVEHDHVARAVRGHLAIACTQNPRCAGTFCYHCRSRLPAGATRCGRCTHVAEHDNPEGINRYFYRPGLMAPAGSGDKTGASVAEHIGHQVGNASGNGADAHLLRNREITKEVAVDQIERMLAMDRVAQPCYRCGVPLLKSTECNALSHCGVQKCYMCGRNALAGGHLEPEHWDAHGSTGCPRYDHHAYWRTMKDPFVCAEGRCYSDVKECKVAAHRAGIEAMHAERRVWHAWGMLRSLAAPLRERVISKLDAATAPTDTARALLLARVSKILGVRATTSTSIMASSSTTTSPARSSTTTTSTSSTGIATSATATTTTTISGSRTTTTATTAGSRARS
ncbi:hypothetical protein TW95_gp1503 [Pandoravirus inopinatum]|uniref:Uncharacterized protein n=1 Tax=Pandoravirus inopinatum TaxID=1605721 RepID=A0A0B5JEN6_9VIRU|nr:hypothetical protein TW95_gp1503 [Pandoravirus inopinatum]AJF98237.1 hypothetical protein [Pandoravirus inopinatum]